MIKRYEIEFTDLSIKVVLDVDDSIFTVDRALDTLEFFSWYYDEEGDLIEEVVKKYATALLRVGTEHNYSTEGLKDNFSEEGFAKVDGSIGIILVSYSPINYDDLFMNLNIIKENIRL